MFAVVSALQADMIFSETAISAQASHLSNCFPNELSEGQLLELWGQQVCHWNGGRAESAAAPATNPRAVDTQREVRAQAGRAGSLSAHN